MPLVRTPIRLAFQDMWQFYGPRVLTGLTVAILAVVLALFASGQATLWTLWAYAIFFGLTYFICLVRRVAGMHGVWVPGSFLQPKSLRQETVHSNSLVLKTSRHFTHSYCLASIRDTDVSEKIVDGAE
jgi:hypothetical protein